MKYINLCTLFDSNYMDKGLVLYESLVKTEDRFRLYILAMDDICEEVLKNLEYEKVCVIPISDILAYEPVLVELRLSRTAGEFCWTCTSILIEYIFVKYQVDKCTYIDSDLCFYNSPRLLISEFNRSGKSVGLTPHRFPKTYRGERMLKASGKYCVEFNTFKNDREGRKLLSLWKNQCIEKCSIETGGDQLYLTDWGNRFDCVYEYQNVGGGLAPWNLMNFKLKKQDDGVFVCYGRKKRRLVFYHFQGIQYSNDGRVNIQVIAIPDGGFIGHNVIDILYIPYLKKIEAVRDMLKSRYGLGLFVDGCGRKFSTVKFELLKFLKAFINKFREEDIRSSVDLLVRVLRKKEDIIDIGLLR